MTLDKIRTLIAEKLSVDITKINETTDLIDDLGADSIDVAELIMDIEDQYEIEISDDDLQAMRKVSDIVKFIDLLNK